MQTKTFDLLTDGQIKSVIEYFKKINWETNPFVSVKNELPYALCMAYSFNEEGEVYDMSPKVRGTYHNTDLYVPTTTELNIDKELKRLQEYEAANGKISFKIEITPKQIFDKGQILTLEVAKTLIGKTIAVTNGEYRMNSPLVRRGKVVGIESEWDLAAKEDISHLDGGKYATRQEYWASYMKPEQIDRYKNRLILVASTTLFATCELHSHFYDEPTFFGSDENRPIYYVVLNDEEN